MAPLPPSEVEALLRGRGLGPERRLACLRSDMGADARFESAWLALGPDRLAVVRDGPSPKLSFEAELARVGAARAVPLAGGGMLVLSVDGRSVELLAYPASQAPLFSALAERLSAASKGLGPEALRSLLEEEASRACPTCSRPFPPQTKVCAYCVDRPRTLLRLLRFARAQRGPMLLMLALMAAGTVLQLAPPLVAGALVDGVLIGGRLELLTPLVACLAAVLLAQAGANAWRGRLAVRVGAQVTHSLRSELHAHLQRLHLQFFDRHQSGALMSRVGHDTQMVEGFLVDGIQYTAINVLIIAGVAAVLLWKNPVLGLLVLLPAPAVALLSKLAWRRLEGRFARYWGALSRMYAYLGDVLGGVREIKAAGRGDDVSARFEARSLEAAGRSIAAEQAWQTLIPALNLTIQVPVLLVWYVGARQHAAGALSVGDLVAFMGLMALMFGPLQLLSRLNDWLARSLTAAERIFEILDTAPRLVESRGALPLGEVRGELELGGVTFGYDPYEPVLKEVSLKVRPGETVGLVGRSGSGKSTLAKLAARLYDPDRGTVRLDGRDLREVRLDDLRRAVGVVLQEPFLFSGSVGENIAFGRPGASSRALIEAAKAANAHDFILRLSDGYDTQVGERGVRLSGGERQRVAIARAILMDPRVVILDEATSSVDTETESRIQEALARLLKGRTVVAIAHRLSTLANADRIVVLEKGQVKEVGSHAELMARPDGEYRRLVRIQTRWARRAEEREKDSGEGPEEEGDG